MFAKYILQLTHENGEQEQMEFVLTPAKMTVFEILLAEGWEVLDTVEEET